MRKVLLDANLLIAALDQDSTTQAQARQAAQQKLTELLSDENVALLITPFIRYEVLRGIAWQKTDSFATVKSSLDGFKELEIDREISELAAGLFRFDRAINQNSEKNIEKRKFDVFHFACAKCHALELASQDSDIPKLEGLYEQYQQHRTPKKTPKGETHD